jgi:hypothetical protein
MQTQEIDLAARLSSLQSQAADQRLHMSLIVDQSAFPRIAEAEPLLDALDLRNVLSDLSNVSIDGASPLLLSWPSVAAPPVKLAQWLYTQGRYANAVSLLLSNLSPNELHAELRARAQVTLPGNLLMVLRYFDTRTLPL